MRIHDTCFGRQIVEMFFDDEGFQEFMALVWEFSEAELEMGVISEEVLQDLFAVIIFAGTDEFRGKALG